MVPDMLSWVKFWSIRRKPFNMNSRMFCQEMLDFFAAMNGCPVPQKHNVVTKMLEKMSQKRPNINAGKVVCPEPDIEDNSFSLRRNTESRNSRDFILAVKMIEMRRLSFGSPCPLNAGNKRKPTLIKQNQMGTKFYGFFLCGATDTVSNEQYPLRSFVVIGVPVSGNSSPCLLKVSISGWGDRKRQTFYTGYTNNLDKRIELHNKGIRGEVFEREITSDISLCKRIQVL